MTSVTQYKYHCRPEYGSKKLLIEIISGVESDAFTSDLFDAIKSIKPEVIELAELYINDEILYTINSSVGEFIISKDIWGLVFIMTYNNQPCIEKINQLLLIDNRFEKIDVDFSKYKTIE